MRNDLPEKSKREKPSVPIKDKMNLTIEEAAAYSNIGENKLREILGSAKCPFALSVGAKKLIKRKEFEKYISNAVEL